MAQLNNVVTLVTGASCGAGRGVAIELGAAGATAYVTGRSVGGGPTTDSVPGTIDKTAREVTDRGGRGIPRTPPGLPTNQPPLSEATSRLFRRYRASENSLEKIVAHRFEVLFPFIGRFGVTFL
jgi:NAD(P)-dependent dehydrogenase (short-subunit alcohol dehydrogenase family)